MVIKAVDTPQPHLAMKNASLFRLTEISSRLRGALCAAALLCTAATLCATETDSPAEADSLTQITHSTTRLAMPLELTARDFVTKIYGVLDAGVSRDDCVSQSRALLDMTPGEDEYGLWLESADGFRIDYYGMQPEVSAMAGFEGDTLDRYGFFFLFPYEAGGRQTANGRQARFCGSLLQELHDMGLALGTTDARAAIFEAVGEYGPDVVEVRLMEENEAIPVDRTSQGDFMDAASIAAADASAGRFIVILSVEPDAGIAAFTSQLRARSPILVNAVDAYL